MTWCAVEYCEASGAILHKLLQHHSPNIPHYGRTLIHQAILCNNERAVEVLLNCGADVEAPIKTTNSETDCPYKHQECLKILASDGADFGLVNSAGQSASVIAESASDTSVFSPQMLVTQANGIEALKKLIEGADIDHNEQDEKGYSAAMIAAKGGYLETFKLLIDAGADLNLQNKRGQTVLDSPVEFYGTLHQAAQHGPTDFVHTFDKQGL
ncbi:hypothetical protein PS2_021077 [Malus domestica]